MKIGIIGAGAIARFLLEQQGDYEVVSMLVTNEAKYADLAARYNVQLYTNVPAFLQSPIDVVVEAATIEAVEQHVAQILHKKPVVAISIGAFADEALLARLQQIAANANTKLYLPAGAIGGLDLLQNTLGHITRVELTTIKPAHSLLEGDIAEPRVIFEGSAAEAIARFPKNMNVSIVLALAGIGAQQTHVKLVASPSVQQNIHQIFVQGDFGSATMEVHNNALPTNPKTSYLAAMSIVGTLRRMQQHIMIG